MKFFCEYCGNRIDAEKDAKCPNCGASYKKNPNFIKLEEEKKKQMQINQENTQKIFKHVFSIFKFSGIMFLMPIIIFIIVLVTIVIIATNSVNKESNHNNSSLNDMFENIHEEITGEKEEKYQEVVVSGLEQFAETKDYKVKVTKYEVEEYAFSTLDPGYEYVKFYLVVENLKNDKLTKEDVNCVVDGIAQTNKYSSGYSDIPMFINKGLTVKGIATFEVPKDANSYEIRYGDYVTIKISK